MTQPVPDPPSAAGDPTTVRTAAVSRDRSRPCLLVVDDQPANIRMLYQALAGDYQVLQATSGERALAICQEDPPDLVLLDVVMPGIDGHEVCRRLKNDPATRGVPVIFVTAQHDPADEARGLDTGAVDFIAKPISPSVVRSRVRTHLALAQTNAVLAATLDATADGILVTDLNGRVGTVNRRFLRMWQVPESLHDQSEEAAFLAHMGELLRDGAALQGIGVESGGEGSQDARTLELRDGRFFEYHLTALSANGKRSGRVFSFRDVTGRRKAERALAELNASLEARILERTHELELARRQADAASRAKSEFLSNMSHEIRTPMNSIIGLTYLAKRTNPSPKLRDYLDKIGQSGEHLLGIISDILDFSKLEAGKLELEIANFRIGNLFANIASQLGDAAERKGLSLRFDCDPQVQGALRGDPLRLGQVLLNYVGNAVKFSSAGQIEIRAQCVDTDSRGSLVRFSVSDPGIGMSSEHMAGLFQSFQQVDASTTRKFGGTGLGLAISKQLANLMGGRVGVESTLGIGSTFWMELRLAKGDDAAVVASGSVTTPSPLAPGYSPAAQAAGLAAEENPQRASEPETEVARIRDRLVLIVDDNLFNQQVATEILQTVGARVIVANDGKQALEMVQARRFDCVLMDVQMPVMDGLQATREIRRIPALAKLPIIAMTANARHEDRVRCLDAGMDDFLTKPVMAEKLYQMIIKWLPLEAARDLPGAATADDAGRSGPTGPTAAGAARAPDTSASGTQHTAAQSVPVSKPAVGTRPPGQETQRSQGASLAGDPEVIDLSILAATLGGRMEIVRKAARMFNDTMEQTLREIDEAQARADLAALGALGHRAKSSAAAVGAVGMSRLCQALEKFRHGGTLAEAHEVILQMRPLQERIRAEINRLLP